MNMDEVKTWLENRLHSKYGARCQDVRIDAKMAGITRGQLKQARIDLKVKTISLLDRAGKTSDEHIWVLR